MALTRKDIITITQGGLLYRDEAGTVCWIDFARCNRNWTSQRRNLGEWDFRCVGSRRVEPLSVEFHTQPPVRFAVEEVDEIDREFSEPLQKCGRWTLTDAG